MDIIKTQRAIHIFAIQFIIVGFISNYVTYLLAFTYHFSWYQLLLSFVLLNVLAAHIVNYFSPFRILVDALHEVKQTTVYGVAIFSTSSLFFNIFVLYKRFGLLSTLGLSLSTSLLSGLLFGMNDAVYNYFMGTTKKIAGTLAI